MNAERVRLFLPHVYRDGRTARVTGAEFRHLRARRVQKGDSVVVFDAAGAEYVGVVTRLAKDFAEVELGDARAGLWESPVRLVLCTAAVRAPRLDFAIEKATELGAAEIVVFVSERTVRSPLAGRQERWHRVALSAAKQSGRACVPTTAGPIPFSALLDRLRQTAMPTFLFHPGAPPLHPARAHAAGCKAGVALVVGPEGGFTEAELQQAASAGCEVVGLGPRMLRTETAALAALAVVGFLWGDLGLGPTGHAEGTTAGHPC